MYRQHHHGGADPFAARQKEEQRRRQQAYAQALAQQVQQRKLQEQRDKELARQGTSHGRSEQRLVAAGGALQQQQQGRSDGGGDAGGKSFWDGFGEKANANRTNFARGYRQPVETSHAVPRHQEQQQQQQQMSPLRRDQTSGFAPEARDPFAFALNNGFQAQEPLPSHQPSSTNSYLQQHFGHGMHSEFEPPVHHNVFTQPAQLNSIPPPPVPFGAPPAISSTWGAPVHLQHPFPSQQESFTNMGAYQQQQYHHGDRFAQHFEQQQQQQSQHETFSGHRGLQQTPPAATGFGVGGPSGDDDSRVRRKQQQQQEIQNALQKQIEEKKRQKLEAKRRQDEEDRREAERFEAEQRRAKLEEEKAKEAKRRKAEEELAREQQAAAALVDHQKKAQQQQQQQQQERREDERQSPLRSSQNAMPHINQQHQPARHFQNHQPSSQKMDPFVNTRAHLFEDSSDAALHQQRQGMAKRSTEDFLGQRTDEDRYQQAPMSARGKLFAPSDPGLHDRTEDEESRHHGWHGQPPLPFPGGDHHDANNNNAPMWPLHNAMPAAPQMQAPFVVDPALLLRQYNEVKEELMNQRRIVDQLRQAHAQIQQQQQQQQQQPPPMQSSSPSPTLSDLEQLRNELREELEQRERFHRQELESLKRQHHHQQEQQQYARVVQASHTYTGGGSSSSQFFASNELPSRVVERSLAHSSSFGQPLLVSIAQNQEQELGSTSSQAPIASNSIGARKETPLVVLQCDSKLVFFDGQVQNNDQLLQTSRESTDVASSRKRLEPTSELVLQLDDLVDHGQSTAASQSLGSWQRGHVRGSRDDTRKSMKAAHPQCPDGHIRAKLDQVCSDGDQDTEENDGEDDKDDTLAFFVRDLREALPITRQVPPERRSSQASEKHRASVVMQRYSSWEHDDDSEAGIAARSSALKASRAKWLHVFDDAEDDEHNNDDDDEDGGASASLTGEELEAIFQRNVRRHEILLGFQPSHTKSIASNQVALASCGSNQSWSRQELQTNANSAHGRVLAWTHLHQQLEANAEATSRLAEKTLPTATRSSFGSKRHQLQPEDSLVASSRWMPSAI